MQAFEKRHGMTDEYIASWKAKSQVKLDLVAIRFPPAAVKRLGYGCYGMLPPAMQRVHL